jgi:alkylated DNA repair dioxygenase AlkB
MHAVQGLLLDLTAECALGPLTGPAAPERQALGDGAWIDIRRGWVSGADGLFTRLAESVTWQRERRRMYDRVVEVPRLTRFLTTAERWPDPALNQMREALSDHYRAEEPGGLTTAGLCLYRDGDDSVAWHGDTIGRGASHDVVVAIVSLGAPRALSLRPRGGGGSVRVPLDTGDLLVMGGSCQRTWDHAVLKTSRPVGPRISIQFRPDGVR